MDTNQPKNKFFRVIDILVLVVFMSTAVWGLYLFRADLMRTLEARDAEPAGYVVIRDNVVQRRHDDSVLWDRLYTDSSVYSGDLIRAADLSSALIYLSDNEIFLNENTLIRIQHVPGAGGLLRVELREGHVNVAGSQNEDSQDVLLEFMGQQIKAGRGAVFDAAIVEEGIAIQVNEGEASIISGGQVREITQGELVAVTAEGKEIDVSDKNIKISPIRFFRAETLASISASARESANKLVREAIKVRETIGDSVRGTVREFTQPAFEIPQAPPAQPGREPEVTVVPGRTANYTVKSGDTLGKIAKEFYGSSGLYMRIVEANNIPNPDLIYPGQVFLIP